MLEYDFEIHYRKGDEMPADYLSRNVFSLRDEEEEEALRTAQRGDWQLGTIIRFLEQGIIPESAEGKSLVTRYAKRCFLRDRILWIRIQRPEKGDHAVKCIPTGMRKQIATRMHEDWYGGHAGVQKTKERILLYYFWPNIDADVDQVIKTCERCQKRRKEDRHTAFLEPLPVPSAPNQRIHADLFGPLRTSEHGKKFILCITDAFTKYVELVALSNKESLTVATAIFYKWICRYGVPLELVTDQGREFVAKLSKDIWDKLQLVHTTTTARHPQCNSQAEVANKTIARYLGSFVDDSTLDWEPLLGPLMFSYNTSYHRSIKSSPFFLTYGVDPRLPGDLPHTWQDNEEMDLLRRLQIARRIAHSHLLEAGEKAKQYHDLHVQPVAYAVGQEVLLDEYQFLGRNQKLAQKWSGPHVILRLIGNCNAELLMLNGKKIIVHLNRVKPFYRYGPEPVENMLPREEISGGGDVYRPRPNDFSHDFSRHFPHSQHMAPNLSPAHDNYPTVEQEDNQSRNQLRRSRLFKTDNKPEVNLENLNIDSEIPEQENVQVTPSNYPTYAPSRPMTRSQTKDLSWDPQTLQFSTPEAAAAVRLKGKYPRRKRKYARPHCPHCNEEIVEYIYWYPATSTGNRYVTDAPEDPHLVDDSPSWEDVEEAVWTPQGQQFPDLSVRARDRLDRFSLNPQDRGRYYEDLPQDRLSFPVDFTPVSTPLASPAYSPRTPISPQTVRRATLAPTPRGTPPKRFFTPTKRTDDEQIRDVVWNTLCEQLGPPGTPKWEDARNLLKKVDERYRAYGIDLGLSGEPSTPDRPVGGSTGSPGRGTDVVGAERYSTSSTTTTPTPVTRHRLFSPTKTPTSSPTGQTSAQPTEGSPIRRVPHDGGLPRGGDVSSVPTPATGIPGKGTISPRVPSTGVGQPGTATGPEKPITAKPAEPDPFGRSSKMARSPVIRRAVDVQPGTGPTTRSQGEVEDIPLPDKPLEYQK
jgi:hypothetical protein